MRSRAPVLAWSLFGLTVACFLTILIWSRNGPADGEGEPDQIAALIVYGIAVLSFATVGALVASRVPDNPIGWLCIAMGLLPAVGGLGDEYVVRALQTSDLSGAGYVALTQTFWNAFIALPGMVLLLFPTGAPPGPRWRLAMWALLVGLALVLIGDLINPATDYEGLANPLGIEGRSGTSKTLEDVGSTLILAGAIASFVSLVFRYRRAGTQERQQLKLLAYSLLVIGLGVVVGALFEIAGRVELSNAVISGSLISIPVSIGFAILKHHLYDIDVIINKTLVYATLTGVLVGIYVALVFAFQSLLQAFTAESDLAVAASTLAVAALFRPLRSRLQGFIDRRFYRRRFDARETLEAFAERLRDDVDLSSLGARLQEVVSETMQPVHVSLWLREGHR